MGSIGRATACWIRYAACSGGRPDRLAGYVGQSAAAKDEVQRLLDEVAALIDEQGILLFAPTLHERRAKLAALLGDDAGHERELREAHRLYTEMGATGHAVRVGRELTQIEDPPHTRSPLCDTG